MWLIASGPALGLVALLATLPSGVYRSVVGAFFLVVLIPALQLLIGAFWGQGAAVGAGVAVGALTLWQVVGRPREMVTQPVQWTAAFTAPDQRLRVWLRPPTHPRASQILRAGGSARVYVCLGRGTGEDIEMLAGAAVLPVVQPKSPWICWMQFGARGDAFDGPPQPWAIDIRPLNRTLPGDPDARSAVLGGYAPPRAPERTLTGQLAEAAFFDGVVWRTDDLSLTNEGPQFGRYFIEVRVFDAAGQLREVWF